MTLQQLVEALDARVLAGDIIDAFNDYAADNCVTLSGPHDITHSKAQKLEALRWYFGNVASISSIQRLGLRHTGDNVTDSQFVFEFISTNGTPLRYDEIIRRTWQGDKVVEEYYLLNQTLGETETVAAKPQKKAAKATAKTAVTAPAEAPAAPAKKAPAKKKAAAADDLTIVEGIGPKIAELFIANGISTFAELAAAKPATLRDILAKGGKRYQIHNPETWPQQGALARDGKMDELKQLQDKLNAGKK
jgi:predicted flap endonuclease-1-like 5' DNA nuclease